MQPTVDAELAGVRKVLEDVSANASLPPEATGVLREAARTLQRVERYWSKVLPYLVSDNAAVVSLLREIAPALSSELREEVEALPPQGAAERIRIPDVTEVNALNERVRAVLSRVIASMPPGSPSIAETRARIHICLLQSLKERPW